MKIRVHGDVTRRLLVLEKELPTLKTPVGELDDFWRMFVFPKLDIRWKKWNGCWMWTGAITKEGEPKLTIRDTFTRNRRGTGIGRPQQVLVKQEIAARFIDARKAPRRVHNGLTMPKPDIDVIHLCGNVGCLNPSHFLVCMDDAKHRDVKKLRNDLLAPGTYYQE